MKSTVIPLTGKPSRTRLSFLIALSGLLSLALAATADVVVKTPIQFNANPKQLDLEIGERGKTELSLRNTYEIQINGVKGTSKNGMF